MILLFLVFWVLAIAGLLVTLYAIHKFRLKLKLKEMSVEVESDPAIPSATHPNRPASHEDCPLRSDIDEIVDITQDYQTVIFEAEEIRFKKSCMERADALMWEATHGVSQEYRKYFGDKPNSKLWFLRFVLWDVFYTNIQIIRQTLSDNSIDFSLSMNEWSNHRDSIVEQLASKTRILVDKYFVNNDSLKLSDTGIIFDGFFMSNQLKPIWKQLLEDCRTYYVRSQHDLEIAKANFFRDFDSIIKKGGEVTAGKTKETSVQGVIK